jgi:hypothetical protein
MITLYASRAVKFAAVVDCKGKLILAKFKPMHRHNASLLSSSRSLDGSQPQQDQTLQPQSCHSFYHEHLMPKLKDTTSRSYREQCSNKAHYEITEISNSIGLKLAVIPLTKSRDKYLCLCLELPPEIRTDEQQIISKLTNVIQ